MLLPLAEDTDFPELPIPERPTAEFVSKLTGNEGSVELNIENPIVVCWAGAKGYAKYGEEVEGAGSNAVYGC